MSHNRHFRMHRKALTHNYAVYKPVSRNKVTICFQPRPLVGEECEVSECIGRRERSVKSHTNRIVVNIVRVCVCVHATYPDRGQPEFTVKRLGSVSLHSAG